MRLLTKTTLYFLVATLLLLTIAGYYLFGQFSRELDRQTDRELVVDELQWVKYLRTQASLGNTFVLRSPDLLIHPVDKPIERLPTITRIESFSAEQNRRVPFRQLSQVVSISGIPFQLTIRRSQEQRPLFIANVTNLFLLVFAGIFITTLLVNWFINQSIWKPFQRSLVKIRGAELQQMKAIHFEESNIKEFNELNASLNYMTGRIYRDYKNMKEFTENAAHEMQTPLAVVQSKVELMLQQANLTSEQLTSLSQAETALKRLGNLNQSLLLLAKIENKQFEATEQVNLATVAKKYLHLFEDMTRHKLLSVQVMPDEEFLVTIHPFLADTMVSNLVGNAIKYNQEGGTLLIASAKNQLSVSNSSGMPAIEKEQLFKRFTHQQNANSTSNGLGLAIVKKIADTHQLQINYSYEKGMHTFSLNCKK
jgi:signal transduction histidine kinase